MHKPAILGGNPAFKELIPITQPTLPPIDSLQKPLSQIFSTGQITNGRFVKELEKKASSYLGAKYAIAMSCCTSGLILTEQALALSGEVILPSFTFCATAHSLLWNNLIPVFVDCKRNTHNIDPQKIEAAITPKTSAILAVDVFGNPCERENLQEIAKQYNLKLIIDAAHSFGSLYKEKQIGGFADAQVFSLSPTKLVVAGEGGIIITEDKTLAEKLVLARNYGSPLDYNCEFAGLNARMEEANAILALRSLEMLEDNVKKRNKLVTIYKQRLSTLPGVNFQEIEPSNRSTYKDFSILIKPDSFGMTRNHLAQALEAENIETRFYFYPPIHQQKVYQSLGINYEDMLPNTLAISASAISLPLYSHMPEEYVNRICSAIEIIHKYAGEVKEAVSGE